MLSRYRKTLIAVFVLLVGVIGFALTDRRLRVSAFQQPAVEGSLEWLAQDAASNNLQEISIPTMEWRYTIPTDIDEAFSHLSVILVHAVNQESSAWNSEYQVIGSWYKFEITEVLSQKPYPSCPNCPASPDAPTSQLPLNPNELLVPKMGGTVIVNGISINSNDPDFSEYHLSQTYLLFLDVDPSKKVGVVSAGPAGVFSVSSSGILTPVSSVDDSIARDVSQRYSNSLAALRSALTSSPPTPTPTPTPCSASNQLISHCINNGGDWDYATCTCN
ncbi:MAG TPA: hypothetical protein VGQ39_24900 [Pyrinomonadaceae bacterium]|jgi:hypothetical protein|nr:hypothetical protein [Pyrinomonadaceae bacterium]